MVSCIVQSDEMVSWANGFRYYVVYDKVVYSHRTFSQYVNDLISELRYSGSGAHIGKLFMGCLLYADDIVLMSPSCQGLQRLVRIGEQYA